jgi:hypothetical protein
MKISFLPKTKSGKLTALAILSFAFFLSAAMIAVALGEEGGETLFDNLKISVPMFLAGGSAIAGCIVGLISIIKYKERSVIVLLASFVSLLITLFLIGEFTFPH